MARMFSVPVLEPTQERLLETLVRAIEVAGEDDRESFRVLGAANRRDPWVMHAGLPERSLDVPVSDLHALADAGLISISNRQGERTFSFDVTPRGLRHVRDLAARAADRDLSVQRTREYVRALLDERREAFARAVGELRGKRSPVAERARTTAGSPADRPAVVDVVREELKRRVAAVARAWADHLRGAPHDPQSHAWLSTARQEIERELDTLATESADVLAALREVDRALQVEGGADAVFASALDRVRRLATPDIEGALRGELQLPLPDVGADGAGLVQRPAVGRDPRAVFVVHGRDDAARLAVERYLRRLELRPIVLADEPNGGLTIIEKLERDGAQAAFAVVLLTGDDEGRLRTPGPGSDAEPLRHRARQNVVLELGYFIGLLGRPRVAPLYRAGVELPSDVGGLTYVPFDDAGGWQLHLARELRAVGIDVDLNLLH